MMELPSQCPIFDLTLPISSGFDLDFALPYLDTQKVSSQKTLHMHVNQSRTTQHDSCHL